MLYITNFWKSNKSIFHSNTTRHFENYIGFRYYAISNITNLAFKFLKKITTYYLNLETFKSKQKKFYNSQFRFWLNDFYIDPKNFNTQYSSTMIQCSKIYRLNSTNFKF
jgi:hypothetical protein